MKYIHRLDLKCITLLMLRLISNSGGLAQTKVGIKKNKVGMANNSNTGDRTWGHLASTESFGRETEAEDYILLKKEELKNEPYHSSTHASHCMFYARNNTKTFGVYSPRAAVLMQVRFDGYIGFPGGLVDKDEDPVDALNRELCEEMNLDLNKFSVSNSNYIVSHYSIRKKLCLIFYALEVSLEDLLHIESQALLAKDYGSEVLGTIRVPLYTMGDGYRGFPTFLKHAFVGNSKIQLIHTLIHCNIMSEEEIKQAKHAVPVGIPL